MFNTIKIVITYLFLMNLLVTPSIAQLVIKKDAKSLYDALPKKVSHLIRFWPDANTLSSQNIFSGNENNLIKVVKESSNDWIKTTLNTDWLPEPKKYFEDNTIMVRNEFNDIDVVHIQWNKNGYNIKVSQTASILVIKLTPLQDKVMGNTLNEKKEISKVLAKQLFNKTAFRYGTRPIADKNGKTVKSSIKIEVQNIPDKIADYSFRPDLTYQFPDGVIGRASTEEDEGIKFDIRDTNEIYFENLENNVNWDKSLSSWGYWWRNVCWWNDGKSIGFFILKREAGPYVIDYWVDKIDELWFEGLEFKPIKRNK